MKNVYIVEFLSADRGFDRFDFQVFRNRRSALRYIDQFMSSVKENAGHLFDRDGVIECKDIYRDEDMLLVAEALGEAGARKVFYENGAAFYRPLQVKSP